MSTLEVESTSPARWLKASVLLCALGFALLSAQPGQAQPGPLTFFKNYFITGDYAVGGVGLRGQGVNGLATGPITIQDVPADADIVAAFLYWQVVTTATDGPDAGSLPVTFKGYPLGSAGGPFGKLLTVEGTAPCWSSGGGTGSSGGSKLTYTYRADVLRYFDVDPGTGKLAVNGTHLVAIPDSGSGGNATPIGLGASLVVIYRDTNTSTPLSAIVLYDGGYTLNNASPTMSQVIQGFYQSANGTGRLTHIVGSGQENKSETLLFNGEPILGGSFGASAGPSWDNPTFNVIFDPGLTQLTTGVSQSSDCLTWGAVIFKTEVQDTDEDGLLDTWETSSGLVDPNGVPLPNLAAMGALPGQKDLFIEVGYMKTDVPTSYGGAVKPAHSHLPSLAALQLMAQAFAKESISVHFDVGNNYQGHSFVIPASLARGGEAINEAITQCTRLPGDPPWVCQFSEYPGTVGWKSGFRFLRDEVFSVTPTPPVTNPPTPLEDYCDAPGYTCERRFDRNRKDMFRYALFAHAIGLPKSEDPASPDFQAPRTNTGVGDFPGGDVMVTLGAFADINGAPVDHDLNPATADMWTAFPVGTSFMQASTLMHELGHNMERRHGGEAFEPNCKPTYLSVMNYLYQLRGLLDDVGKPHLDFSGSSYGGALIGETSLADGPLGGLPYRIGWYAPLVGSYLEGRGTPALKHCDGSVRTSSVDMVRIDARTAAGPIDWKANGIPDPVGPEGPPPTVFSQDINFNGRSDASLLGSNDWATIRLNQLGGRRNTGGLLIDSDGYLFVGPLSLDSGRGDLGRGDLGRGDLGRGDLGRGDLGRGDLGRGDLGGGDLFVGNPYQEGELDAETAGDLARTPPNEFTACVIGVDCPSSGTPLHARVLGWTAPNVGGVSQFVVYRVAGDTLVPDTVLTPWTTVAQVTVVPGQMAYSLVDGAQLLNEALYTYFAVAIYADGINSDPSNLVTITAVNEPPAAGNDTFSTAEDTPLIQATPGVLVNDADPDSPATLTAVLVDGPSHGALTLNADGSFTYTPAPDYYGADAFTYKAVAAYGAGDPTIETNVATVTISVSPVNDAPVAGNDSYITAEDTPLAIPAPGVLANDIDIDSSPRAVLVTGPSRGTLLLNLDGSFTYTPAANYSGPDSFTYRTDDGTLSSNPATVSLSVTPVNDPPVAVNDSYSVTQGTALTVAAPGVLGNDTDIDSTLTAAVITGPSNGTLSLAANGSFTYTPAATFYGTDSFTYRASDGAANSTATVTMTVNRLVYGFVNVQNLPPPSTKTFKPGSAVPLAWRFTVDGTAYNSVNARPRLTIRRADNSVVYTGTPTDPGASSFQAPTASNGYTWQFNWQTKNLVAGAYYVYVTSEQTEQTFPNTLAPPSGGYKVTLK